MIKALKFHKVDPQESDKKADPPKTTQGHLPPSIPAKRMLHKSVDTRAEMPGLRISSRRLEFCGGSIPGASTNHSTMCRHK